MNRHRSGAIFENLVILELLKAALNRGQIPQLSFWRDYNGMEVGLIAEHAGQTHAFEIKAGSSCHPEYLRNLQKFGVPQAHQYLAYTGNNSAFGVVSLLHWQRADTIYKTPVKS